MDASFDQAGQCSSLGAGRRCGWGSDDEAGMQAVEPNDPHRCVSPSGSARLLKRAIEIEMEHCPNGGGELKIIAAILETAGIERSLQNLGPPARVQPQAQSAAAKS